ncbi:MAG TPA: class II aldolase/adducin family protein [Candidatus Acidoferrales bacterium]|jgi:HCOMODA/2-hydroxy-3-carboxy-muconic semialdehyde decarboxylase|nr:class II aldolase/adducin family protein [Candidatus Acidoferrales bacterium]
MEKATSITRRGFLSGSGLALTAMLGVNEPAAGQNAASGVKTDATEAMASLIWDLVAANRILADQDVLDGYGHVSVRSERDAMRYLLARSMAPEITSADDIMEYDLDSNPIDGRGRAMHSERFIHGEIYKVRPEVKSVVHFHAPSVVLMSVSGETLRPIYHMAGFIGDGAPLFDIRKASGQMTNMLISDGALGRALAQSLGNKPMALMRGHGAVVVGESLQQAVGRSVYVKVNAEMQVQALGKRIEFLEPEEARLAGIMNDSFPKDWDLWKEKAMKR